MLVAWAADDGWVCIIAMGAMGCWEAGLDGLEGLDPISEGGIDCYVEGEW